MSEVKRVDHELAEAVIAELSKKKNKSGLNNYLLEVHPVRDVVSDQNYKIYRSLMKDLIKIHELLQEKARIERAVEDKFMNLLKGEKNLVKLFEDIAASKALANDKDNSTAS
ncbi:hypothetical protein ACBP46_02835 [Paenalcaligenes hominis]|uniref:hypothetical protein n=1 Tax=Paenalcaligenes hominis TaxID=643674 RepID=UPI0035242FCE